MRNYYNYSKLLTWVLLSSALSLGLALTGGSAMAVETTVRVMISPSGSGPYNAFATVQTHMQEFSKTLRLKVEETPEDFKGKRVGIGMLTQNEWGMHQRLLLDQWGLRSKLASLDTLGPGQNIAALLDGRTDVGTRFGLTSADGAITVVTGPHRKLEVSNRKWHYVRVPAKMITGSGIPFRVVEYSPNILPNQPQKVEMFGDLLMLSAHKSMPADKVKEFVRVFIDHAAQIRKYHGFFKPLTGSTLSYRAAEHPEFSTQGPWRPFVKLV